MILLARMTREWPLYYHRPCISSERVPLFLIFRSQPFISLFYCVFLFFFSLSLCSFTTSRVLSDLELGLGFLSRDDGRQADCPATCSGTDRLPRISTTRFGSGSSLSLSVGLIFVLIFHHDCTEFSFLWCFFSCFMSRLMSLSKGGGSCLTRMITKVLLPDLIDELVRLLI